MFNKTSVFVNTCATMKTGPKMLILGGILFKKIQIPFREQWAAWVICQKEAAAMFGDTNLPLALIMEEILGWEKKPGQRDEPEEQEETDKEQQTEKGQREA